MIAHGCERLRTYHVFVISVKTIKQEQRSKSKLLLSPLVTHTSPRMKVFSIVPELRKTIPVWIHRDKHRFHDSLAQLILKLVRDRADFDELRWTNIRTMTEPKVQHDERPVEVLVCHGLAVHVHEGKRPAQRRFPRRFHL